MKLCHQIAIQSGVPVLFYGEPGTGKSSSIMSLGRALDVPTEVVIASIREPSDFAGLPVLTDKGVILHAPSWAHRLALAGKGIAFLDEITTAPPAVQAALLRVVLDKYVGDLPLPDDVFIIAAANPPEQAAGGWELAAPLSNRFCHIRWCMDNDAWVKGMVSGFPTPQVVRLPDKWKENYFLKSRSLVAAFMKARPALLLQLPKEESNCGKPWASPRSWTNAAQMIAACDSVNAPKDVRIELVAGCVGEGPAMEFVTWAEELDLPDPETLIADPDSFKMPNRGDRAFAVLASVASAILHNNSPKRWQNGWKIMAKAHDAGQPDIAASAATMLAHNRPPKAAPTADVAKFSKIMEKAGII